MSKLVAFLLVACVSVEIVYSASIRRTRGADDDVLKNIEADIIQPGQKVETNKPDVVEVKKGISSVNAAEGGPASGGEAPAGGLGALGGLFSQLLGSVKDQAQKSVADDLAKEVGNLAQKYGGELLEKFKGAINNA